MSLKYPQICQKDEEKFEGMLSQFCEKGQAGQKSKVDNSYYGLFNIVSDEENMDARKYVEPAQCPWHYTDTFECLILGFVMAFVLMILYKRWQAYRANKREQKLNGIRTIYM